MGPDLTLLRPKTRRWQIARHIAVGCILVPVSVRCIVLLRLVIFRLVIVRFMIVRVILKHLQGCQEISVSVSVQQWGVT